MTKTDVVVTDADIEAAKALAGLPADEAHWRTDSAVQAFARRAQAEREAIVAWLRAIRDEFPTHSLLAFIGDPWTEDCRELAHRLANAIERGEHHAG